MKIVSFAVASLVLAASAALAQENMFSTHPGSNTVTVVDAQKFADLPTTGAFGPNPIATAVSPQTILHDAARGQIYVISAGGTMAYDTLRFTSRSVTPATLTGPLTTGTMDSKYLYAVGADTAAGKVGVYRFDLDNFTAAGVTFVGGLTPAASTTYTPVDVDVIQGKAYFTYNSLFSGLLAILIHHVGEVDLATGAFQDVFAVNATSTTQPLAFTKITRSPDGQTGLVAATTQSTGGVGWQLLRITPSSLPVVDVLNFASGCSPTAPEDIVFTTSTAPYTVCMIAADDCSYALRFFTVGPTGPESVVTNGAAIPAGFGQDLTPDLAHNRIWLGNTGATNGMQFVTPPTPAGAFLGAAVNSGGQSPRSSVVVPAPPPLILDTISQPAGVVTVPFQIEMTGAGFISGSSRGILVDPAGVPHFPAITNVINSGRLIASFPAQTVTHYDAGVVNNDGQIQLLTAYYQGMNANPPPGNLPVSLPSLFEGYRLLSFPEYSTVGDLRAAAAAQLGQYDPIFYRIFLRLGNGYVELNSTKLSPSTSLMGTGVFALSRNGATLNVASPSVTANSTIASRTVVIQPGWNIISQPWVNGLTSTMPYASLQVHTLGDLSDAAVAASVSPDVTNVLFEASGGVYVTSNVMTAGRAYWILNVSGGPLYLVFNQASVTLKTVPSGAKSVSATASVASSGSATPPPMPGASLEDSGGSHCGLLGADALLVLLFLRLRRRRTLSA
jgi:hypothetical protein